MKTKLFHFLYISITAAIFAIGYITDSKFEMICAVCAAPFWVAQLWLYSGLGKEESAQRKLCKPIGWFMLLPSLGMIAVGIRFIFLPYTNTDTMMIYATIALSAILSALLVLQVIVQWKDNSLANRFLRQATFAAMSAPLAIFVALLLHLTQAEDNLAITCMTIEIFAGLAFLTSVNMIIVSICGYKSTRDSIKTISALVNSKKLVFTRLSIFKDIFLVLGKVVISVVSVSFFMFTNALYSSGVGIARFLALKMHTQDKDKKLTTYRYVGIIISGSSICYVLYSVRLLFGGKTGSYDMIIALIIAMYTFFEFGINIREAIRLHKSKALEAKALRAVSFSSTLICFVLTQTAIMSFAAVGEDTGMYNAISGMVFGTLASLIGLYIIIDSRIHRKAAVLQ